VAPDGERFVVPSDADIQAQEQAVLLEAREFPGPKVVVQGLGFVGAAVAAVVSNAVDGGGKPRYFVLGVDLPTSAGYWKIAKINSGRSPFASPDPDLEPMIHHAVREAGNLRAVAGEQAYGLADVIIVDVPLDVVDRAVTSAEDIELGLAGFEAALRTVGRAMRENALVMVETTVAVGTTEKVILPILRDERAKRGIHTPPRLAHAYERVMPGPRYVDSIRRFWRTFAGVDAASAQACREFLETIIDTHDFPLRQLSSPTSSELGKVLENSYRAANIAFIHEWTLMAEEIGIDLFEVIESIRVRKGTHDNLRYPGFGVGGYCLTKDSLLAQWSLRHLFGSSLGLPVTLTALGINYQMPRHTLELLGRLLDGRLQGRTIAVCGVSYLPEVPDTRNSPTELLVDDLLRAGAQLMVHDPCVRYWPERPEVRVHEDLAACLAAADGVVLAVPHHGYTSTSGEQWVSMTAAKAAIVDAQNILSNEKAETLHRAGRRLLGVGKGHWRTLGLDR
jgi:nucleotide sugar dehydrogenase